MSKKSKVKEDPILDLGIIVTLLSFLLMIGYANPINPLPFMVSIVGLGAGLYIIALRIYPKEAKYWRKFLLEKLDFLFDWSKESIQKLGHRSEKQSEPVRVSDERKSTEKDAMAILKLRLAKGEITKEQYEELKNVIKEETDVA